MNAVQNTYKNRRLIHVNSHGSGCTLSAAITAGLARGLDLRRAVALAKDFITASLRQAHDLRPGTRVIDHFFRPTREKIAMADPNRVIVIGGGSSGMMAAISAARPAPR